MEILRHILKRQVLLSNRGPFEPTDITWIVKLKAINWRHYKDILFFIRTCTIHSS